MFLSLFQIKQQMMIKKGQPNIWVSAASPLEPSYLAAAEGRSHVVAKDLLGTHDKKAFVVVSWIFAKRTVGHEAMAKHSFKQIMKIGAVQHSGPNQKKQNQHETSWNPMKAICNSQA